MKLNFCLDPVPSMSIEACSSKKPQLYLRSLLKGSRSDSGGLLADSSTVPQLMPAALCFDLLIQHYSVI
jgi:hypothetical protein